MKKHAKYLIFLFAISVFLLTCGCSSQQEVFPKHSVYKYGDKSIEITKEIKSINLTIDSGNVQIYCWDKNEIRYEAKHTARGNKTEESLQKLLRRYRITAQKIDSELKLNIAYDGKINNAQDFYTDLKVTIPRRVKTLDIHQQIGTLRVEDKIEGQLLLKMDSVNCEIGDLKGLIKVNNESGNVRLNSGKIADGSTIDVKIGNIYIKAECENESKYSFATDVGNIELNFPVSSTISLKSYGSVEHNQFAGIDGNIHIDTSTRMGKITVNGY